jgi:hypothetical protein
VADDDGSAFALNVALGFKPSIFALHSRVPHPSCFSARHRASGARALKRSRAPQKSRVRSMPRPSGCRTLRT